MALTLRQYAEAKRLPVPWLSSQCGAYQRRWLDGPAVWFPVWDRRRTLLGTHVRTGLDGAERFRWARGSQTGLYGLWRLHEAQQAGYATLVEGESDSQTLWRHDEPAIGLLGVSVRHAEWLDCLDGVACVYVVAEPDQGGQQLLAWLNTTSLRTRLRVIALPDAKDPSALYLQDPARFPQRWQAARQAAVALTDLLPPPAPAQRRRSPAQPCDSGGIYAQVKARTRLEDYFEALGCRLQGREPKLTTRCPVHDERNASCTLNTEKQLWYCFGCGKGGDVWTLDGLVGGPLQAYLPAARG